MHGGEHQGLDPQHGSAGFPGYPVYQCARSGAYLWAFPGSILTGLQPYTSGNYQQVKDVDINKGNATVARSTFMPDNFEQDGYRTMGVGKIYHHADHGYHLGEKNRFAKQALWERDTRTILIFQEPGQKEGRRVAAPVQLVDIYPTLTDLAGLPDYELAEGHSLSPLLDDPETD